MSNRHKQTKVGEPPPCQCPKCTVALVNLGGVLPFVSLSLLSLPDEKRKRRTRKKESAA